MENAKTPQLEVAELMIELAQDAAKRESFIADRSRFLEQSGISKEAQEILAKPDQNAVLAALQSSSLAIAVVVIVLETVTTDVVVL